MEWVERFNQAIQYIEAHLTEEINGGRLAEIACCSPFHFQRMFAYMTGVPLSEYLRRRRMTLAAADLRSGQKVLDVALRYGYDSPTAFNRAFQSVHGIPPSAAREDGVLLKSYPPISFTITVKGAVEMEYRIEKKDAFRIVGKSVPLHKKIEKNFATLPKAWGEAAADGTLTKLAGMMNHEPPGVLGVSFCMGDEDWRYYIAVATDLPADGFEEASIPAATWAIFPGQGTSASIQELETRIITEWLPPSDYEYANAPDVEVYLNADPENARYEVWLPITPKA